MSDSNKWYTAPKEYSVFQLVGEEDWTIQVIEKRYIAKVPSRDEANKLVLALAR